MSTPFTAIHLRPTVLNACIVAALALGACVPAFAGTVTNCNDSGPGSFREQVNQAASGDTVDFSGLTCSLITLTSGEVSTSVDVIDLHGSPSHRVVIDGGLNSRIIHHTGGSFLDIENLTLQHGKYSVDGDAVGGCIASAGAVQLDGVSVLDCQAASTGAGTVKGGGVYALTGVALYSSTIGGNIAISGHADARGGGVYSGNGLRTNTATLSNNGASGVSSFGGGALSRGDAYLQQTTVSANSAAIGGGLFLHFGPQATPNVVVFQSTISGNSATTSVGGIFSRAPLILLNSTVTNNTEAMQGGGVYLEGASKLDSTIVSGNRTGSTPMDIGGATGASITGSHNLIGIPTLAVPADTDFTTNPGLGPLADNGGATRTHLPNFNSLAVDRGHLIGTATTDQRGAGFPRLVGGDIDIGAIEFNTDIIFVNGFN